MSEGTKIQWADDTANFWRGCTKVSPGCAHCYAEKNIGVKMGGIEWGKGKPRVKSMTAFAEVRRWNKKSIVCEVCGTARSGIFMSMKEGCVNPECASRGTAGRFHRRRVFSLSLGDWLDEEVPIEWWMEMMQTILDCPNLDFLLLTKRPENWVVRVDAAFRLMSNNGAPDEQDALWGWLLKWREGAAPENVWLGVSVENQAMADLRIPQLLQIPAKVRFLSCEPLLGPVDLSGYLSLLDRKEVGLEHDPLAATLLQNAIYEDRASAPRMISWVIVGGESGPKARECATNWIRQIVAECQRGPGDVACFVKQLGASPFEQSITKNSSGMDAAISSRALQFKDKKGGDICEWPADLRVREFPGIQEEKTEGTEK